MYPSGGFEEVWAWTLYKLSKIFNIVERSHLWPQYLRILEKGDDRSKNYCPVNPLSVVSKIFEKLKNNNNRPVVHLEKYGLFSDFQYGFNSSWKTGENLIELLGLDRSGAIWAIALDISKAFNRLWHAVLLHKLKSNGPYLIFSQ